ncbi:lysylphosphatidylglycerol synthase transmembrane domain-containing protein [Salipaludibacillus aurantiacus]|nr:lysylphosphatidylglycerol synthase transmembrane domain-containing protein [Salipaludibacillus aurantiacus]
MLIIIMAGALLWALVTVDLNDWRMVTAYINWPSVMFIILIQCATFLLMGRQWVKLLKYDRHVPLNKAVRILLISAFTEGITPSAKFGSEAAKGYLLRKEFGLSMTRVISVISVQKVISLAALIPFLILAAALITNETGGFIYLLGTMTAAVLVLCYVMKKKGTEKLRKAVFVWTKKDYAEQVLMSALIWFLFPLKAYLLSLSLNLDISFIMITAVVFLPYAAALLPLTPGGLGTFEAVMVGVLAGMAIAPEAAIAFTLLFRLITFWLGVAAGGLATLTLTAKKPVLSS